MASITIAESVEFLPLVYANCCIGWIDCASNWSFQPFRLVPVQSPYARLTCAVPYLATSASSPSVMLGWALSASISTASLAALSLTTNPFHDPRPTIASASRLGLQPRARHGGLTAVYSDSWHGGDVACGP